MSQSQLHIHRHMSQLYRFKPQKDRCLNLVAVQLSEIGISANAITALGLCLALCAGLIAFSGYLYEGLAVFAASAACDALDGTLARIGNTPTRFGLYFDGIADRFSELFFISGAVLGANVPATAFVVVAGSFVLLFARSYSHTHRWGTVSTTFGRPERLSLLVVGVLCPAPFNTILFIIAGLCCVFSAVQIVAYGTELRIST